MPELTWKEAIVEVLRTASEPMHRTDIAEAIAEQNLRSSLGATPAHTVVSTITSSMRDDGDDSPFVRISRGYYSLRKDKTGPVAPPEPEQELEEQAGLVKAFGMYWRRDYVLWASSPPSLLGHQQPGSTAVNFTDQRGIYLLHDGSKVVYVGRSTEQPLGARLRRHTMDRLNGRWDRFSWFGVCGVSEDGSLSAPGAGNFTSENLIATMEALLIEGLEPPQNRKRGDEFQAVEFLQVEDPEIEKSQIVQLMDELKKKL